MSYYQRKRLMLFGELENSKQEASSFKVWILEIIKTRLKKYLQFIIHGHLHKVFPPLTINFIFKALAGSKGEVGSTRRRRRRRGTSRRSTSLKRMWIQGDEEEEKHK